MNPGAASAELPLRVVIVEDHTLVRQSLIKTVDAEDGFEVVGEASRGDEAIRVLRSTRPDLVLLDVAMPGGSGLDVAAEIRQIVPDCRLLFLTMHEDDATISRAVALGADGYVVKTASTDELLQALRAAAGHSLYLSPAIARRVMDLAGGRTHGIGLTERELRILQLLATGARPGDVAGTLFVAVKTVKNHLTNIYSKLGVQSAAQAVAEAYRRGLVSSARASE